MIYTPDGALRYSPRDLISYLEGDFATWCDRLDAERKRGGNRAANGFEWVKPDRDEELELAARMGQEHESRYLAKLRSSEPRLAEIARDDPAATARTLDAMRDGAPIIYQAHLTDGDWQGYPDFLYLARDGRSRFGHHHYYPADTKLARSAKPYFLLQLCAYAEMLESIQDVRPAELVFVLGDEKEVRFQTGDFFYYYRRLKESFLAFQKGWSADRAPDPALDRSWASWSGAAERLLADSDHLSLVANITRGQIRRFEAAAIATLHALVGTDVEGIAGMKPPVFERLRLQARLQVRSHGAPTPAWEFRRIPDDEPRRGLALLPPPSPGDVFFDMEGFPFGKEKLEYLFGAAVPDGETPAFHDWWAHDDAGEQRALEGFLDWVVERRRRHPDLHIYHYNSYETAAVKRLMGKYGTREDEVDNLLRGDVFVDLYTVVRQGMVIGTPSYSLKYIERLYLPARQDEIVSAGGSTVEYQRWLDLGESRDWQSSPVLRRIRDYNETDCRSTYKLRDWLLERQREGGIAYLPDPNEKKAKDEEPEPIDEVARRLVERGRGLPADDEGGRLDRLIGWLVEFHRREEKPMWWRMFERHDAEWDALEEDVDCLANVTRTGAAERREKRSWAYQYRFDPDQETKLHAGSKCFVAGDHDLGCEILSMDQENGLLELKVGTRGSLPDSLCLIPNDFVSAAPIKKAIGRYAAAWEEGRVLSQAVDDLLRRRTPRVQGHEGGALVEEGGEFLENLIDVATRLQATTLCIQGPPGTGKTCTAAAIIARLMKEGYRIGVTANSHKVIYNLIAAVVGERRKTGESGGIFKAGKKEEEKDEPVVISGDAALIDSKEMADAVQPGTLACGTAWAFSRLEMEGRLDYLFIDEAGQFSLANAVAVGTSTRNLILVGDQMQLSQPLQGTHPGESGTSRLEYLLQGHQTVPPDLGVFLGKSYRMHQRVCGFISDGIYEGRLRSDPSTAGHRVLRGNGAPLVDAVSGIAWVPVEHDGCEQSSEEEVEAIGRIVDDLLTREVVDKKGGPRPLKLEDILVVAPYNMQVRALRKRLGPGAKVGSVDLFQGQEAAVAIVSLCASTIEEAPRGAEFVLSPNRLNVAISRAQALAIVVASPELARARCRSMEEMKLVNLLCHLMQYAGGESTPLDRFAFSPT